MVKTHTLKQNAWVTGLCVSSSYVPVGVRVAQKKKRQLTSWNRSRIVVKTHTLKQNAWVTGLCVSSSYVPVGVRVAQKKKKKKRQLTPWNRSRIVVKTHTLKQNAWVTGLCVSSSYVPSHTSLWLRRFVLKCVSSPQFWNLFHGVSCLFFFLGYSDTNRNVATTHTQTRDSGVLF